MMGRLTLALITQSHQSWLYASHRVGFSRFVLTVSDCLYLVCICVCVCVSDTHSGTPCSDKSAFKVLGYTSTLMDVEGV